MNKGRIHNFSFLQMLKSFRTRKAPRDHLVESFFFSSLCEDFRSRKLPSGGTTASLLLAASKFICNQRAKQ